MSFFGRSSMTILSRKSVIWHTETLIFLGIQQELSNFCGKYIIQHRHFLNSFYYLCTAHAPTIYGSADTAGPNWTFVELKLRIAINVWMIYSRLNRTFVGLKPRFRDYALRRANSLNRTFVELKHLKVGKGRKNDYVLIEPLWNWNSVFGIHTKYRDCLNRTFVELKHHAATGHDGERLTVLIEPLWNWNCVFHDKSGAIPCLNRTFVELKLAEAVADVWDWMS